MSGIIRGDTRGDEGMIYVRSGHVEGIVEMLTDGRNAVKSLESTGR